MKIAVYLITLLIPYYGYQSGSRSLMIVSLAGGLAILAATTWYRQSRSSFGRHNDDGDKRQEAPKNIAISLRPADGRPSGSV